MRRNFYLVTALMLVLLAGAGVYAYTYTTSSATIGATAGEGDIARVKLAVNRPGWDIVLEELRQEKIQLQQLQSRLEELRRLEDDAKNRGGNSPPLPLDNSERQQLELQIQELQQALLVGEVPKGNLFTVIVNKDYGGSLLVKVYLTNAGTLAKAYQYLDMRLILQGSEDGTQVLNLDSGVATFRLNNRPGSIHELGLSGGSYRLVSSDPSKWEEGWGITPELYCEITQR
ncbi:MAG: hypothetical protein COS88_00865 [Chloroflexi bacterium CG07_land_8_20_14_0_80_51_10]|nr:MAG: hypothetical protein COS88_00865 [Chloroflexi bacterium CG07_land_8_20_14_0_80_51_10]